MLGLVGAGAGCAGESAPPAKAPAIELDPGIVGSRFLTRQERATLIAARDAQSEEQRATQGPGTPADGDQTLSEQARALFGDSASKGERAPGTLGDDPDARATPSPDAGTSETTWTIVLATFRPGQFGEVTQDSSAALQALAQTVADQAQSRAGLADVRVVQRGGAWLVCSGNYHGAADERAQADLRRIKDVELDGIRPFEGAMLLPPEQRADRGSLPEFDLSTARARFGAKAEYTLQVAIYRRTDGQAPTREDLAGFREAAENAVLALRRDGQESYYYHGPRGSTVTVGLFGEEDHATQERDALGRIRQLPAPRESAALIAARAAHPYNLVNGEGVRVRSGGREAKLQPSLLIKVPK